MKKKHNYKGLFALVAILFLILEADIFSGCGSTSTPDHISTGTDSESILQVQESDLYMIVADNETESVLILIDENSGQMTVDSVNKLFERLVSLSINNASISIVSTSEKIITEHSNEDGVVKIIIEGEKKSNAKDYGDWSVDQDGNNIYITGGSEWALRDACDAFANGLNKKSNNVLAFSGESCGSSDESYLIIAANQKNNRVEVYDITKCSSTKDAIWAASYPEPPADARARLYNGETVIMSAYGGYSASMVEYKTKKTIWETDSAAFNPHACELIPSGGGYVIGVASSTGGEIRFFEIKSPRRFKSVKFADAHGLLYDPSIDAVWAVGENRLCAFKVELTSSGIIVIIPAINKWLNQPLYDLSFS